MYFTQPDGTYVFDGSKLKDAQAWCFEQTKKALEEGKIVVVSNTFSRKWEYQTYMDLGYRTMILIVWGNYTNTHEVSDEVIQWMSDRWEY
jgi:hypothetical protein